MDGVKPGGFVIQGGQKTYTIDNLLTDPHVVYNENNLPYATTIQLSMPLNEEITPVESDAIIIANPETDRAAQNRHFDTFLHANGTASQPQELALNYGEKLIILEDTASNNPNQAINGKAITIIENDLKPTKNVTIETNVRQLAVRIYKACRYLVVDHLFDTDKLDKDIYWLQNKAEEWTKIVGLGKILATAALAMVGAREDDDDDDEMSDDYIQTFYYNGTVAFAPIEVDPTNDEPVTPFEPVIAEATIADQINGNIFSDDLIQFSTI